jgi:uncharacterized protein
MINPSSKLRYNESISRPEQVFLSAEWRDLVMLNYVVQPGLLNRYVPIGTTLDAFNGKTYVSLVGFRFCRTRLLGYVPVPFHVNFEEVNLRFYVRRKDGVGDRRGVVFIAEIVPRRAIAATARLLYGENYRHAPMRHIREEIGGMKTVEFHWKVRGHWCRLWAQVEGVPEHPPDGSFQQFITEHYWGYSAQPAGGCIEYHVSHVPWQVWTTEAAGFAGDASALYGRELGTLLQRPPDTAFVADGSPVIVSKGNRIL